jgi:hypothetical protein
MKKWGQASALPFASKSLFAYRALLHLLGALSTRLAALQSWLIHPDLGQITLSVSVSDPPPPPLAVSFIMNFEIL